VVSKIGSDRLVEVSKGLTVDVVVGSLLIMGTIVCAIVAVAGFGQVGLGTGVDACLILGAFLKTQALRTTIIDRID